jgi:hypothetical protein
MIASADTRRMAETRSGSGRSPSGAVPEGQTPNPPLPSTTIPGARGGQPAAQNESWDGKRGA